MENCYIVRLPENNLICFYTQKDKRIVYKKFENNKWGGETLLMAGALGRFTVAFDPNNDLYLFCQNADGHVMLCTNRNGQWHNKMILQNQSNTIYTIQLTPIISENRLFIIYNVPNTEEKNHKLVCQTLDENGQWSPAVPIDHCFAHNGNLFTVQHASPEHVLLFYHTRTPENNVGYRELTPTLQGRFNSFYSTTFSIADTAFLTTDDTVHTLVIMKNMFSTKLIYRKKQSETFEPPVLIWEAQRLDQCLLFFVKNQLHVCFTNNGQLYCSLSKDNGATFSQPARYKNKFCLNPIKATYLDSLPQSEGRFYCRQVYVDAASIWDVQLLPDLHEDFYPSATAQHPAPAAMQPDPPPTAQNDFNEQFVLENQRIIANRQNQEKDQQLLQFKNLVKTKNDALKAASKEHAALTKKIASLEKTLESHTMKTADVADTDPAPM